MKPSLIIIFFLSCVHSVAQKITYDDHILPILESACTNCHNTDKKKGDLDLTTYRGLITGSSGGKIVIPGDGAGSSMFTTSAHLAEPFMPPKGEKLGKKEMQLIRAWIDGGLLETKDSQAKKENTPKINFAALDTNKPNGPPPLPSTIKIEPVTTPENPGNIAAIGCSPWAPLVAITSQRQVLLYNTESLELLAILPFSNKNKPLGNPEILSFHPSGKYLLAGGGYQGKSGSTITWDIITTNPIMVTGKEYDSVSTASLRPDLKAVSTSGPSRIIKLWSTEDNSLFHKIKKHTDWVTSMAYSRDGVLIATADRNGGLHIWEAQSGNPFHTLKGHKKSIVSLRWSQDSNYLASASEDGSVRVYDINTGKEIRKLDAHKSGVLDMDWSKKGEIITVGRDHSIKLWRSNYSLIKQINYKQSLPTRVRWSHNGSRFITADYAGIVTVWDTKSHQAIGQLTANPRPLSERIATLEKDIAAMVSKAPEKSSSPNSAKSKRELLQRNLGKVILAQKEADKSHKHQEEQIKQLKTKIEQLKKQEHPLRQKYSKQENERKAIANKIKQFHRDVAKWNKELQNPKHPKEKSQHLLKQKNTTQQKILTFDKKYLQAQASIKTTQQSIQKMDQLKKSTWATVNKHYESIKQLKKQRQIAQQTQREIQKKIPKLDDEAKKEQSEQRKYQLSVAPLYEKLERLKQLQQRIRENHKVARPS